MFEIFEFCLGDNLDKPKYLSNYEYWDNIGQLTIVQVPIGQVSKDSKDRGKINNPENLDECEQNIKQ